MAQSYFSLLTTVGRNKLALAASGGAALTITALAIGDGNGAETSPTAASTALVREVWRTAVESVGIDPANPSAVLVAAIIPTTAGGWWMREFGVFDTDGDMIAVAKPVSQYKPTALEGQLEDILYEFQIIVGETANVTMLVDPSVLLASRNWVSTRKIPMGQLMRMPWLPVISMSLTAPPSAPAVGDTYLVAAGATGAWAGYEGKIAEWSGTAWGYVLAPNGHGIALPDGRIFERVAGEYIEKIALDSQSGKWNFGIAGGTANALTVNLSPTPASMASIRGVPIYIMTGAAKNTAAMTVNLNGFGNVPLKTEALADMAPNAVPANTIIAVIYDGVQFQKQGGNILASMNADGSIVQTAPLIIAVGVAVGPIYANNVPSLSSDMVATKTNFLDAGTTFSGGVLTIGPADAGVWQFNANLGINAAINGWTSKVQLRKNATFIFGYSEALVFGTPATGNIMVAGKIDLAAGDTVGAYMLQNTGGTQGPTVNSTLSGARDGK